MLIPVHCQYICIVVFLWLGQSVCVSACLVLLMSLVQIGWGLRVTESFLELSSVCALLYQLGVSCLFLTYPRIRTILWIYPLVVSVAIAGSRSITATHLMCRRSHESC